MEADIVGRAWKVAGEDARPSSADGSLPVSKRGAHREWRRAGRCAVLLSATLLSGCVWWGFEPRTAEAPLWGEHPGPVATLQNLEGTEFERPAMEALVTAGLVVSHPDFVAGVSALTLRPRCGAAQDLSGADVLPRLEEANPFSLVARKPGNANAVTALSPPRVAVRRSRFRNWSGPPERRAELIDTLVHEWTHLVPGLNADGEIDDSVFAFADKGHGTSACPDLSLVSYALGEQARIVYERHHESLDRHAARDPRLAR